MRSIIKRAINPLRFFINDSRATGVILILCTICSLLLTNLSNANWYKDFWTASISFMSSLNLPVSIAKWVNDFLMSFFFLLAGMEIKREIVKGELSTFKTAVLPFGAALGGMVVPALIFLLFNSNTPYIHGWGIPTATDIAFSIGVASLFGKRVPVQLKILLMALAIIDDLGAIAVIAIFYGGHIQYLLLIINSILYLLLWTCNYFKVQFGWIQILVSLALWYSLLNSGIEGSITGVLVAFALPVNMLSKIEKVIHQPVNFIIIPMFALANTAIAVHGNILQSLGTSISMGVMVGLVIGKPIGIFLFSKLLVFFKVARLPHQINWKQLLGMGTLAGIGFTMSIFTTGLAFKDSINQDIAKIAILVSVLSSLIVSWIYFKAISVSTSIKHLPREEKSSEVLPELSIA
jgi:Na+:H+ antiporter, NhaA family